MSLGLQKRRSIKNVKVLQRIQNNSLVQFSNYGQSLTENSANFRQKYADSFENTYQNMKDSYISISESIDYQNQFNSKDKITKSECSIMQYKFYQKLMNQCSDLTFSKANFKQENKNNNENSINKENQFDRSNIYNNQSLSYFSFKQLKLQRENYPKENNGNRILKENNGQKKSLLNEKLMECQSKLIGNIKKLDEMQNSDKNSNVSLGCKKMCMIQKLINCLQRNKEVKLREMYEQRQKISQLRQEEKKQCQKKFQKMSQVEEKYKTRKIDQMSAILKIYSFRG